MKDKLIDFVKAFLLVFSMGMGFYFTYAFVWFAFDLPVTHWAGALLAVLAGLTVYGFYRWVWQTENNK